MGIAQSCTVPCCAVLCSNKRGAAQQQCSAARALKENREMEEKAQRGSWVCRY